MNDTTQTIENTNTTNATAELETAVKSIADQLPRLQGLHDTVKSLGQQTSNLEQQFTELRRLNQNQRSTIAPVRPGFVSDNCARHLAAQFVIHCERSNKLEGLSSMPS